MNEHKSVHGYFGLTYANYLVMHRTLMEAMPVEWQDKFVRLLDEYDNAWRHIDNPSQFKVDTGKWVLVDDMSDEQREQQSIVSSVQLWEWQNPEPQPEEYEDDDDFNAVYQLWKQEYDNQWSSETYISADGNGDDVTHTRFFFPAPDTIDHYRRPRKYTPFDSSDE